jgi:hypothetical protein
LSMRQAQGFGEGRTSSLERVGVVGRAGQPSRSAYSVCLAQVMAQEQRPGQWPAHWRNRLAAAETTRNSTGHCVLWGAKKCGLTRCRPPDAIGPHDVRPRARERQQRPAPVAVGQQDAAEPASPAAQPEEEPRS